MKRALCLVFLSVFVSTSMAAEEPPASSSTRRPVFRSAPQFAPVRETPAKPAETEAAPRVVFPRPAKGESVPVALEGKDLQRRVIRLRSVPAMDAASILNDLFRAEGQPAKSDASPSAVILADAASNSLVVSGPPAALEQVAAIAEALDQPPQMVELEVLLGEVPIADAKPEKGKAAGKPQSMEVLARARLTTLNNQPATLQIGSREPRVMGSTMSPMGRSNSVSFENIGTMMLLTPRVGPDGFITADVNLEDSRLGPKDEGPALDAPKEGEPIRVSSTITTIIKTTFRAADGESVTLAGSTRNAAQGKAMVLVVTPRLLRPKDPK